jgi:hypothetical protein
VQGALQSTCIMPILKYTLCYLESRREVISSTWTQMFHLFRVVTCMIPSIVECWDHVTITITLKLPAIRWSSYFELTSTTIRIPSCNNTSIRSPSILVEDNIMDASKEVKVLATTIQDLNVYVSYQDEEIWRILEAHPEICPRSSKVSSSCCCL